MLGWNIIEQVWNTIAYTTSIVNQGVVENHSFCKKWYAFETRALATNSSLSCIIFSQKCTLATW